MRFIQENPIEPGTPVVCNENGRLEPADEGEISMGVVTDIHVTDIHEEPLMALGIGPLRTNFIITVEMTPEPPRLEPSEDAHRVLRVVQRWRPHMDIGEYVHLNHRGEWVSSRGFSIQREQGGRIISVDRNMASLMTTFLIETYIDHPSRFPDYDPASVGFRDNVLGIAPTDTYIDEERLLTDARERLRAGARRVDETIERTNEIARRYGDTEMLAADTVASLNENEASHQDTLSRLASIDAGADYGRTIDEHPVDAIRRTLEDLNEVTMDGDLTISGITSINTDWTADNDYSRYVYGDWGSTSSTEIKRTEEIQSLLVDAGYPCIERTDCSHLTAEDGDTFYVDFDEKSLETNKLLFDIDDVKDKYFIQVVYYLNMGEAYIIEVDELKAKLETTKKIKKGYLVTVDEFRDWCHILGEVELPAHLKNEVTPNESSMSGLNTGYITIDEATSNQVFTYRGEPISEGTLMTMQENGDLTPAVGEYGSRAMGIVISAAPNGCVTLSLT